MKSSSTYTNVSPPTLKNKTENQRRVGPTIAPTGGFFSGLREVDITTPSRAFINNNNMAQRRAIGTVPENAMTPDVHSAFWTFGGGRPGLA